MNIVELTLIVTIVAIISGIIYMSFTEIFVEEQKKKRVVSNKVTGKRR